MNKKGFTLVEILATIVILGILTVGAILAYTKYIDKSKNNAYDTLAKSAADAAAEYNMVHMGTGTVTLKELVESDYLKNVNDPSSQGKKCFGWVDITHNVNYDGLETEEYDVTICCANYERIYHFPGGEKGIVTCPEE